MYLGVGVLRCTGVFRSVGGIILLISGGLLTSNGVLEYCDFWGI